MLMKDTRLFIVPTPIGNLEDITLRAIKILKNVDTILAEDTRVTAKLLQHLSIKKKVLSYHSQNEHKITAKMIQRMLDGEIFALVSDAGTPGISDPGFLLVKQALEKKIVVECLPGPTAFVPALIKSGLPCDRFIFEGFAPQKKGKRAFFEQMKFEKRTIVFYESPHRLIKTLELMIEILGNERLISISKEISKLYEQTLTDTILNLLNYFKQHEPKGEYVIVVQGYTDYSFS